MGVRHQSLHNHITKSSPVGVIITTLGGVVSFLADASEITVKVFAVLALFPFSAASLKQGFPIVSVL